MTNAPWQPPQPGDPGTPRDVNRDEDVVWDGRDLERYAGQNPEKAAKKTTAKKATGDAEK